MFRKSAPLFAVIVFAVVSLACGQSNAGQVVATAPAPAATQGATRVVKDATKAPTQVPTVAPTKASVKAYTIGDMVQVEDHTITLNSAKITGGILKANFTIENSGKTELAVSSMLSFSAKDTEGTKLEQEIFECGAAVDGKVLPGDKSKGDICWKASGLPIKIYYIANLFGSGAVVWEIK